MLQIPAHINSLEQCGKTFTALEIMDADATSSTYDWAITLIDSSRLTDFAGVAWPCPGWLPVTMDLSGYTHSQYDHLCKIDGDMFDSTPTMSPCGMPFGRSLPGECTSIYQDQRSI